MSVREIVFRDACWSCGGPESEKPKGSSCRYKDRHVCGARHGSGIERCELPRGVCRRQRKEARDLAFARDPSVVPLEARDVVLGLVKRHRKQANHASAQWAYFTELRLLGRRAVGDRSIDFYAINLWPSRGVHFVAYEVKISRSDLLSELKQPEKRQRALQVSTEYYLATPVGLVQEHEVPPEAGLIEVRYGPKGGLYVTEIAAAPVRPLEAFDALAMMSLAARVTERKGVG